MIDCHTHWGRAWTERDGDNPSEWLKVLDRYGISHAVVLPEVGLIHAGKITADHDSIARVSEQSNRRMIPFCTANIWYEQEATDEMERCLDDLGFRGVKFHTWLQGFSVSSPIMDQVCEIAADRGAPVLFHDGTPPFALPSQIALLAQRHPRTTFILGHCGLLEYWREAAEALRCQSNLWGCLCGPHSAGLEHILQRCDRTRLVWGSDFGYSLADCYSYRIGIMHQCGLNESELEAIYLHNARRLLNL